MKLNLACKYLIFYYYKWSFLNLNLIIKLGLL